MSDRATPADAPDDDVDTVEISVYEAVGGQGFFDRLVDAFYDGVVTDPVLLPLYPEADLTGARRRLSLFLNGRNILDVNNLQFRYGSQTPGYARVSQVLTTGVQITLGLKGTF